MFYLIKTVIGDVELFGVTPPKDEEGKWPVVWQNGSIYKYWDPKYRFDTDEVVKQITESEMLVWRLKYGV